MRVGIISDVHSNIEALKAVFEYFKKNKIENLFEEKMLIFICLDIHIKNIT